MQSSEQKSSSLHKINMDSKGEITKGKIINIEGSDTLALFKGKEKIAEIDLTKDNINIDIKEKIKKFENTRKKHLNIIAEDLSRSLSLLLAEEINKTFSKNKIGLIEENENQLIKKVLEKIDEPFITDKIKFDIAIHGRKQF